MATITATTISNTAASSVTVTTLDGTDDTFTIGTKGALLILSNPTAGTLSPVITGDESVSVTVQGLGVIDTTSGTSIFGDILADGEKVLKVNVVGSYLKGVIDITGGTGLTARLLEF